MKDRAGNKFTVGDVVAFIGNNYTVIDNLGQTIGTSWDKSSRAGSLVEIVRLESLDKNETTTADISNVELVSRKEFPEYYV